MKTFATLTTLMVIVFLVTPAMGAEPGPVKRVVYENAIDEEITRSREMASLLTSRSPNLRKKGHREASMAMFLETHRDRLVDDMLEMKLEPKDYKVERFLNERFSCTCYATWAAK